MGGIDENRLLEPLQRQAVQTMIETYGQTPAQLFSDPHPERKRSSWLEYSSYDGIFPELDSPTNQTLTARRSPNVERAANRLQGIMSS